MDYLRIGESKLKIAMTKDDLRFYGMDLTALDYASTETRRAFWAILDDAKHATGFDAAATKVCVQIYTSKTGGCEMFITSTPSVLSPSPLSDDKSMALTVCGVLPKLYGESVCYFETLTNLLAACKILFEQGYNCGSSAWQMSRRHTQPTQDGYYLYLAGNESQSSVRTVNSSGILAEFGKPMDDLNRSYLSEHCIPLVEDHAVERLSALAV